MDDETSRETYEGYLIDPWFHIIVFLRRIES
jgi:hypothetical protein